MMVKMKMISQRQHAVVRATKNE